MMKTFWATGILVLLSVLVYSQDMKTFKLYNPDENAEKALASSLKEAKASGKHVFVQIGGNWCVWCARFHQFINDDKQIDSAVSKNYVVYHMNYSPENKNQAMLKKFSYPQRFGFPVFIILDADGNRLHTQNSAYLEEGKGYNKSKVIEFLDNWGPGAFQAERYKDY